MRAALVVVLLAALVPTRSPDAAEPFDARKCYELSDGVTSEMLRCGARELEIADTALNEAWRALRTKARRRDGEADDGWSMSDALLKAQRAWLVYRDNNCEAEMGGERGRTLGTVIHQGCLIAMTQNRAKQLRSLARSSHLNF